MSESDQQTVIKKLKIDKNGTSDLKEVVIDSSGDIHIENFILERTLLTNTDRKSVTVLGKFEDKPGQAIVLLEKKAFCEADLTKEGIFNKETQLVKHFHNDIYSNFDLFPKTSVAGIKLTVVHPADEKLIQKYSQRTSYLVEETPELYTNVTLPYILADSPSVQWVYNILEGKCEAERVIYSSSGDETGFLLFPDLKWDGHTLETLYFCAAVHNRSLKSIRDLNQTHLPLLRALKNNGERAIFDRFGLRSCDLRVYLHYQPSYYHLHVHFTALKHDAPGIGTEKAHLLNTVINNIEMMGDYYQKATLTCRIYEGQPLHDLMVKAGAL